MTSEVEWIIDCEECDNTTFVKSWQEAEFCPICGRRADVKPKDKNEHAELLLEDD